MPNFIAIIPARFESSRFPGKPLVDIAGKTMIQRTYEQAQKAFEYVLVATDDRRISEHVQRFGGQAVMTSESHQSGTDRCNEALTLAQKYWNKTFDIVVNVQGDEPFISPRQLHELKQVFFDFPNTEIASLIKEIDNLEDLNNPNRIKVTITKNKQAIYFSRQAIPYVRTTNPKEWFLQHTFYKHIGLYAYRANVLRQITQLSQSPLELAEKLEQLRWIENGYAIQLAQTQIESYGVDAPEDIEKILEMLRNKKI